MRFRNLTDDHLLRAQITGHLSLMIEDRNGTPYSVSVWSIAGLEQNLDLTYYKMQVNTIILPDISLEILRSTLEGLEQTGKLIWFKPHCQWQRTITVSLDELPLRPISGSLVMNCDEHKPAVGIQHVEFPPSEKARLSRLTVVDIATRSVILDYDISTWTPRICVASQIVCAGGRIDVLATSPEEASVIWSFDLQTESAVKIACPWKFIQCEGPMCL